MQPAVPGISVRRLGIGEHALAAATLTMMAQVFDEPHAPLGTAHLERLLGSREFWLLAALDGDRPVGGITAHALPLTRIEAWELLIYDLAVHQDYLRRGIGRQLVHELTAKASSVGIAVAWVPADNEDAHALEFYRSLGAQAAPVTIFTFDS